MITLDTAMDQPRALVSMRLGGACRTYSHEGPRDTGHRAAPPPPILTSTASREQY